MKICESYICSEVTFSRKEIQDLEKQSRPRTFDTKYQVLQTLHDKKAITVARHLLWTGTTKS